MHSTTIVRVVVFSLVVGMSAVEAIGQQPVRLDSLMKRKLDSAQKVLASLVMEDYETVEREAQRLHLYSQESDWNVLQTREYRRISDEFRASANRMAEAAKRRNIDSAGLAYVRLTLSCIECHRHVRQQAEVTPPPGE